MGLTWRKTIGSREVMAIHWWGRGPSGEGFQVEKWEVCEMGCRIDPMISETLFNSVKISTKFYKL